MKSPAAPDRTRRDVEGPARFLPDLSAPLQETEQFRLDHDRPAGGLTIQLRNPAVRIEVAQDSLQAPHLVESSVRRLDPPPQFRRKENLETRRHGRAAQPQNLEVARHPGRLTRSKEIATAFGFVHVTKMPEATSGRQPGPQETGLPN